MKTSPIASCTACPLYQNQAPLLDRTSTADIIWVGLSAKKVDNIQHAIPLDIDTSTGKIVASIEKLLPHYHFYKTNLVKCLPLDDQYKLRYPHSSECDACCANLIYEREILKPKLIILLSEKVGRFVAKKEGFDIQSLPADLGYVAVNHHHQQYLTIHHPSYI